MEKKAQIVSKLIIIIITGVAYYFPKQIDSTMTIKQRMPDVRGVFSVNQLFTISLVKDTDPFGNTIYIKRHSEGCWETLGI